ncbi:hypothetical protein SELMODRAFT_432282 [Selaginella moellendorffii]|uniref:Endonuclease/exonuclease/phosphatase domain-containing protein n=1 Tax=Selaginella moellendorffii TaxID=88036 RepID=D8TFI9_SELML|nr:hypothetical protein SELMODRAFT_432282 [Selaginella moellendorffii]
MCGRRVRSRGTGSWLMFKPTEQNHHHISRMMMLELDGHRTDMETAKDALRSLGKVIKADSTLGEVKVAVPVDLRLPSHIKYGRHYYKLKFKNVPNKVDVSRRDFSKGWRFWHILGVTTAEEEKRPPPASTSNPKTTDVLEGKWEDKPPSKDTQGANLVSFPEASDASSPPAKPRKKPRQPRIAMGVFPDKKSKEIYLGLQAKVLSEPQPPLSSAPKRKAPPGRALAQAKAKGSRTGTGKVAKATLLPSQPTLISSLAIQSKPRRMGRPKDYTIPFDSKLEILIWHCHGLPHNSGLDNRFDILCLVETWEHPERRLPDFPGYSHWSWNWNSTPTGRGNGGIAIYIKDQAITSVSLQFQDEENNSVAIRISSPRQKDTILVVCYFSPDFVMGTPFPFATLAERFHTWAEHLMVIIAGDLNCRTGSYQASHMVEDGESEELKWRRHSRDRFDRRTGQTLLNFCQETETWILNGIPAFPNSSNVPSVATTTSWGTTALQITIEQMKAAVQSLPRKKAADVYGFMAELLQALDLAPILCQLFHEIIQHGFPQTWNINRVVPIYKAGDPALPSNYRTIMISTIFAKLLAKVVEQHLVSWTEAKGCRASMNRPTRVGDKGQPVGHPCHSQSEYAIECPLSRFCKASE